MGLKPCPFCGGKAEFDSICNCGDLRLGGLELGISVYCVECGVEILICCSDVSSIEIEQVEQMWNRRTP